LEAYQKAISSGRATLAADAKKHLGFKGIGYSPARINLLDHHPRGRNQRKKSSVSIIALQILFDPTPHPSPATLFNRFQFHTIHPLFHFI
jgi:hypothetical protein